MQAPHPALAVYKITPLEPEHSHWEPSRYRGLVWVRASGEMEARYIARAVFQGFRKPAPGETGQVPDPWIDERCSRIERDLSGRFPDEGRKEVIIPAPGEFE